jgi:protein-S-isoprenylcysteine O-methyltransferase Ste14
MKKKNLLMPPHYLVFTLILTVILHIYFPVMEIIYFPNNLIGLVFILLGAILNVWADVSLKRAKTTTKPHGKPSQVVKKGPYGVSRHPMYLGFVLIVFGVSVFLGSLMSFLTPLFLFLVLDRQFVPLEEELMEKLFSRSYAEYKGKVRKWL